MAPSDIFESFDKTFTDHPSKHLMLTPTELELINYLIKNSKATKWLEIGTFLGRSLALASLQLYQNSLSTQLPWFALSLDKNETYLNQAYAWLKSALPSHFKLSISGVADEFLKSANNYSFFNEPQLATHPSPLDFQNIYLIKTIAHENLKSEIVAPLISQQIQIDGALVDANKGKYLSYFNDLAPLITHNGFILFDNIFLNGQLKTEVLKLFQNYFSTPSDSTFFVGENITQFFKPYTPPAPEDTLAPLGTQDSLANPVTQTSLGSLGTRESLANPVTQTSLGFPGTQDSLANPVTQTSLGSLGTQDSLANPDTQTSLGFLGTRETLFSSTKTKVITHELNESKITHFEFSPKKNPELELAILVKKIAEEQKGKHLEIGPQWSQTVKTQILNLIQLIIEDAHWTPYLINVSDGLLIAQKTKKNHKS